MKGDAKMANIFNWVLASGKSIEMGGNRE